MPPSPASLSHVPVIFGTAGHIDHGKSSLVRALTGTDPDRLKEEKERGITIELGFAFLDENLAFIDVPGHERFVKHMVAGAATIDYAVLVVAADDGVMPQTREHLDILTLLDVHGGLVAITKADMADDDLVELVKEDVQALLPGTALEGAPVFVVDSLSRRGLPELERAIRELAAGKRVQGGRGGFRMPIDRVFTLKGFGTVVTGSVLSGAVRVDDRLVLQPSGTDVRVRGLQSQSRRLEQAVAGQRAAVNLVGVAVDDVHRGDVVASPGLVTPSDRLLARVSLLPGAAAELEDRQRVHVHIGTTDRLARVFLLEDQPLQPGATGYLELRLEEPVAALRMDRFIVRRFSPVETLGGGVVLDPAARRGRPGRAALREVAVRLDATDQRGLALSLVERTPFATAADLAPGLSEPVERAAELLSDLVLTGEVVVVPGPMGDRFGATTLFQRVVGTAHAELAAFHEKNPLRAGMGKAELTSKLRKLLPETTATPVMERALALGLLQSPSPELVAAPGYEVALTRRQRENVAELMKRLDEGGLTPPSQDDLASAIGATPKDTKVLLTYLVDTGRAACLEGTLYFAMAHLQGVRARLAEHFARVETAAPSDLRDHLATTRKYLIPLLEYADARRWTVRDGDLRRAGPTLNGVPQST